MVKVHNGHLWVAHTKEPLCAQVIAPFFSSCFLPLTFLLSVFSKCFYWLGVRAVAAHLTLCSRIGRGTHSRLYLLHALGTLRVGNLINASSFYIHSEAVKLGSHLQSVVTIILKSQHHAVWRLKETTLVVFDFSSFVSTRQSAYSCSMLIVKDASSSWLDAYWWERHFDVTRAKHPRTRWHQAARWSAMMKPAETCFRCAVSICHFLSFFPFFFFFLCTARPPREGEGWGWGLSWGGYSDLARISTKGESGEGWQQGWERRHMQNWRKLARNRERTEALPRWTKQSLPATGGCLQEFQNFIYSGGTFFCELVWVYTHARAAPKSECVRAVRTHKSNTVSLQRALAAARDTQFQWRDEKWIKEQQKKGRQAE